MKILGISCFYHESAAALLKDGQIIAASAEERFSRLKHDPTFPEKAIEFCLQQAKLQPADLDYLVFYEKPFLKFERNLVTSLKYFPASLPFFVDSMRNFLTEKLWIKSIIAAKLKVDSEKILFVPHHLSHAAASFYPSPFKKAAFLTLDGIGEWTSGLWGIAEDNRLLPFFEMRFPNSVGLLYSTLTSFLGFEVNDGEYKLMGLAAYGKPRYKNQIKKLYHQLKDGSIRLNLDYFDFYKGTKYMYSEKFFKEFIHLEKTDLAASIQACTEEIVLNMLDYIFKQTKQENLIYGGGVALNSVLNSKITTQTPFKDLFIFPAAGDDGGAVGAALYLYHHVLGNKQRAPLDNIFWGAQINNIHKSIPKNHNSKLKIKKISWGRLIDYVAQKLTEGKVIGWFEGRAEFGPRALGHRSILADPRSPQMKDQVNSKIKFREQFRPFAPAVLEEYARKYFKGINQNLAKFMLGTFASLRETRDKAPAIIHIDNSSRVQIVDKNYSGNFRKLLEKFYQKTDLPMLLNTSFNLRGEPIVNSAQDALKTFSRSGLDILVLENYIIEKDL